MERRPASSRLERNEERGPKGPLHSRVHRRSGADHPSSLQVWLPGLPLQLFEQHWLRAVQAWPDGVHWPPPPPPGFRNAARLGELCGKAPATVALALAAPAVLVVVAA